MKKETPILDKYKYFMLHGIKGENGLCENFEFDYPDLWSMVSPSDEELQKHVDEGYSEAYWGEKREDENQYYGICMTPLRQNIVLLMACLNDEL